MPTPAIDISVPSRGNPLDVVERMASTNEWSFERAGEDEITILVRGKWTDYQLSFTWMFDLEALLSTALDASERYFPAYQFVVWAGKSAREALDAAMFKTAGEA